MPFQEDCGRLTACVSGWGVEQRCSSLSLLSPAMTVPVFMRPPFWWHRSHMLHASLERNRCFHAPPAVCVLLLQLRFTNYSQHQGVSCLRKMTLGGHKKKWFLLLESWRWRVIFLNVKILQVSHLKVDFPPPPQKGITLWLCGTIKKLLCLFEHHNQPKRASTHDVSPKSLFLWFPFKLHTSPFKGFLFA